MKRMIKKTMAALLTLLVMLVGTVSVCYADAVIEDWWDTFSSADYYVYVDAPDGGVNLRYGPGVEYDKQISSMIPNGTKLHIVGTANAQNGKLWGETDYQGYWGFVFLGQCSTSQPASSANTSQAPKQESQPSSANTGSQPAAGTGTALPESTNAQQTNTSNIAAPTADVNTAPASDINGGLVTTDPKADVVDPEIGGGILSAGLFFNPIIIILALVIIALLIAILVITIILLVKKNSRKQ